MDIMLPTLRKERAATYSPVLPISEKSGIVLQVPVEVVDADAGLIAFDDEGETRHAVDPVRQGKAAVEGRLGDALGCTWRRL
jgi:lysyl-tRNA synthetase class 1